MIPLGRVGGFQLCNFRRVVILLGQYCFTDDCITKTTVEGEGLSCMCCISAGNEALQLGGKPGDVARVVDGGLGREKMLVGVERGGVIVVPKHLDVVGFVQFIPRVLDQPSSECPNIGLL